MQGQAATVSTLSSKELRQPAGATVQEPVTPSYWYPWSVATSSTTCQCQRRLEVIDVSSPQRQLLLLNNDNNNTNIYIIITDQQYTSFAFAFSKSAS